MQEYMNAIVCGVLMFFHYVLWLLTKRYLYNVDPTVRESIALHAYLYTFIFEGMFTIQYVYLYMHYGEVELVGQSMLWTLSAILYAELVFPVMKARDKRIQRYLRLVGQSEPYEPWYGKQIEGD